MVLGRGQVLTPRDLDETAPVALLDGRSPGEREGVAVDGLFVPGSSTHLADPDDGAGVGLVRGRVEEGAPHLHFQCRSRSSDCRQDLRVARDHLSGVASEEDGEHVDAGDLEGLLLALHQHLCLLHGCTEVGSVLGELSAADLLEFR